MRGWQQPQERVVCPRLPAKAYSHEAQANRELPLQRSYLLPVIVNKGIEVVKERRRTVVPTGAYSFYGTTVPDIKNIEYIHNFPQFIGRVKDSDSKKPVNNACITMYIDGLKAYPAEPGWINPYFTNALTRGVYSFWPQAIKSTANKSAQQSA